MREGDADVIEIGTPLIKCAGANVIKSVKESCRDTLTLADLKTLDASWLETEIAAGNGADIVTVSALAHNITIVDAVMRARNFGIRVMTDLMQVPNPVDRSLEMCDLVIDYPCIHTGIDTQRSGSEQLGRTLKLINSIMKNCSVPIAVVGGMDDIITDEAVRVGATVVVVGAYITKSTNAYETTREIRSLIDSV